MKLTPSEGRIIYWTITGFLVCLSAFMSWLVWHNQSANQAAQDIWEALQHNGSAVIRVNKEGIIQSWGPNAVKISGYTREDAIGNKAELIISEDFKKQHDIAFSKRANTKTEISKHLACDLHRKDGKDVPVFVVPRLMADGGFVVVIDRR